MYVGVCVFVGGVIGVCVCILFMSWLPPIAEER